MVVVGGEEVEGGEASGESGVVLQAAVRSAVGKKNIIDQCIKVLFNLLFSLTSGLHT